jgi:hypothetical protein
MDLLEHFVKHQFVSLMWNQSDKKKKANVCFLVTRMNSRQVSCTQSSCQNGGTCQGPDSVCICKPGFTGQRCESGMINLR